VITHCALLFGFAARCPARHRRGRGHLAIDAANNYIFSPHKFVALVGVENLVIVEGNKKLAMAYATHVLDVYDHFAWRWTVNQKTTADAYLKTTPDEWLNW